MPNEPLTFPMTWEKCPVCGDTRQVANEVKEEQKAKGKIGPGFNTAIAMLNSLILDPRKIVGQLTAPILTSYLDICAKCGVVYCVRIDRQEQNLAVPPPSQSGQPAGLGRNFLHLGQG